MNLANLNEQKSHDPWCGGLLSELRIVSMSPTPKQTPFCAVPANHTGIWKP